MDRGEEREQARLIRWSHRPIVRELAPALAWLFHTPNGGKRDGFTGAQMRAMGVKPGVPDLLMPIGTAAFVGLAIEMKAPDGRVSTAQSDWLGILAQNGWKTAVCFSADEAYAVICEYIGLTLPPLDE